ncbi:MAG TPA: hypothetical protein VGF79_04600 [Bacteroidia bacterium]
MLGCNQFYGQVLIDNKFGEQMFSPFINSSTSRSGLIKINSNEQSLGFNYFALLDPIGKPRYKFANIEIKSKPTEGLAPIFRNGQFSPGFSIAGAITQVKIFDKEATKPENNFIDWGSFDFKFGKSKYQMYNADTTFDNQLYSAQYSPFSLNLSYSILAHSSCLISFKIGYLRSNNTSDLELVEVLDKRTQFDTANNTTRDIVTTKTARNGIYKEMDSYPINFSIIKLTPDDASMSQLGYGAFFSTLPKNGYLPITDVGLILYYSTVKNGNSTPVIGLNIIGNDFFDVRRKNNGLLNRLSLSLTSVIKIF